MAAQQNTKQEAEKQRREAAARRTEELESLRARTAHLEVENARLAEEVAIWKNAQTAASTLSEEMEKLRASHARMKAELSSQVAENSRLKREKVEVREEIKRTRALAAKAEKSRVEPTVVNTVSGALSAATVGKSVQTAQTQVVACLMIQRAIKKKMMRLLGRGPAAGAGAKLAPGANKARAGSAGSGGVSGRAAGGGDGGEESTGSKKKKVSISDVEKLNGVADKSVKESVSKFAASANAFTFGFRGLDDYFGGLESYVGTPSPDIFNAMERCVCISQNLPRSTTTFSGVSLTSL